MRFGINYFWSIKNSNDVLNKFKSKTFQASKLSTYDFSTLVFFSPFSIAITSLGEERANLSAFRTLVRFVLVYCRFPLTLWIWEGLRFVIVALPGLFSYFFCIPRLLCLCHVETLESLPVHSFNGVFISSTRVCTLQSPFVFLFLMILIYTSLKVRYLPVFVSRL